MSGLIWCVGGNQRDRLAQNLAAEIVDRHLRGGHRARARRGRRRTGQVGEDADFHDIVGNSARWRRRSEKTNSVARANETQIRSHRRSSRDLSIYARSLADPPPPSFAICFAGMPLCDMARLDRMVAACRSFTHDGVEIAFLDEGEGEPIVLVHGFASNKEVNWVGPGWVTTLTRAGRRVIALDNRGHGALQQALRSGRLSQRDHGRGRAGAARSSRPAARRCHGLFHGRAHHGLSGAGASRARALRRARRSRHPARRGRGAARTRLREALEAPSLADVSPIRRRYMFRAFAEQTQIRLARARRLPARLAADARAATRSAGSPCRSWLRSAATDQIAGSPEELAALIPGARALVIPGRDHMLAVGDRVFKTGVLEFLSEAALKC